MKYKLTDETKEICGKVLHRIVCVTAFASVAVGDTGGWVESEKNLSQSGNDKWRVGCFFGTGEELIEKAYKDSKLSGDCYKAVVELRNKLTELESA